MNTIDRYILKSFLFNFIGWNICFVGIFVVFDLFTNFDSLLQAGQAAGNVPKVLFLYYFFKSIPIVLLLGSILSLAAAMVTLAMLMRNNELVPIQAAGISTLRILRPIIIAVFCTTALSSITRELLLPNIQDQIVREVADLAENRGIPLNVTIDNETNITLLGERVFRSEKRITKPEFAFPRSIAKQSLRLSGEFATSKTLSITLLNPEKQPLAANNIAGYLVSGVQDRHILQSPSIIWQDRPILITPFDAADFGVNDLQPDQCFVATNVPFERLASRDAWQYASLWTLISAAQNKSLDVGYSVHTAIHSRLTQPILDMSLLFLGLPVLLIRGGQNVFKAVGLSGLVLFAFLIVCYISRFVGTNSGMPVLGVWIPMMIFVPLAVNQFYRLRDEV